MKPISIVPVVAVLLACTPAVVIPPPTWNPTVESTEGEYAPFLQEGTATVSGQAFMTQQGGGVVKGAGRNVTLDPATTTGNEWWGKAGKVWPHRDLVPPSPSFLKARRSTVADAEGRFSFSKVPAGKYYLRTEVTWDVAYAGMQGGLVGHLVEIKDGKLHEFILNQFAE